MTKNGKGELISLSDHEALQAEFSVIVDPLYVSGNGGSTPSATGVRSNGVVSSRTGSDETPQLSNGVRTSGSSSSGARSLHSAIVAPTRHHHHSALIKDSSHHPNINRL